MHISCTIHTGLNVILSSFLWTLQDVNTKRFTVPVPFRHVWGGGIENHQLFFVMSVWGERKKSNSGSHFYVLHLTLSSYSDFGFIHIKRQVICNNTHLLCYLNGTSACSY